MIPHQQQQQQGGGGGDPLKELFNWAVANSSSDELRRQASDSTGNPQQLTAEKREILEYIASQMKGTDPYTVMKKALIVIRDETSSVDDTLDAMDQIDEIVGKIDFATDFHKMKGNEYLFEHFLSSESEQDERGNEMEIKLASLQIICTCLHNNPAIQTDDLYQVKFFNYLEDILDNPQGKGKAILKKVGSALAALSSNQPNTLKQFTNRHIIGKISKIMNNEQDEQVLSKFMFSLLNFMIADHGISVLGEEIEYCWTNEEIGLKTFILRVINDLSRLDLMEKTALFLKQLAKYHQTNNNYSFISESKKILSDGMLFIKEKANSEDRDQLLPYFDIDNDLH